MISKKRKVTAVLTMMMMTAGCASLSEATPGTRDRDEARTASEVPSRPAASRAPVFVHHDPVLATLLARLPETPDLQEAEAAVREAAALAAAARAGLFPELTAQANGAATAADTADTSSLDLQLGLTVPIDLFGTGRSRSGAALNRAQEAALRRDALQLNRADVLAQTLVALRLARIEQALRAEQLVHIRRIEALEAERQRAGLASNRPGQAVRQRRGDAESRIAAAAAAEANALAAIERATGARPGDLAPLLSQVTGEAGAQRVPQLPDFGDMPASLVEARPDVAAEAKALSAAVREQDAARADRWPRLSLGAVLRQFEADGPAGAGGFTPAGFSTGLTANLLVPLFDFGRLRSLEGAARARADARAARYRSAIIRAVSEVAEARRIAALRSRETAALDDAFAASARDFALASARFMAGLDTGILAREAAIVSLDRQVALSAARARQAAAAFTLANRLGLAPEK